MNKSKGANAILNLKDNNSTHTYGSVKTTKSFLTGSKNVTGDTGSTVTFYFTGTAIKYADDCKQDEAKLTSNNLAKKIDNIYYCEIEESLSDEDILFTMKDFILQDGYIFKSPKIAKNGEIEFKVQIEKNSIRLVNQEGFIEKEYPFKKVKENLSEV